MIVDIKEYYANQPIPYVRARLNRYKKFKDCLYLLVEEGAFEEAHLLSLRTQVEHLIEALEEIVRISEETIRALKSEDV